MKPAPAPVKRPIPFTSAMVMALLGERKTKTRRIMKPQPRARHFGYQYGVAGPGTARLVGPDYPDDDSDDITCPYGQPGDRLWVKEAFKRIGEPTDGHALSEFLADGALTKADCWPWKLSTMPAMFCPMGLSRITLEITDIRVEQLQDISEKDAIAEGVERDVEHGSGWIDYSGWRGVEACLSARDSFRSLWESLHGKDSWGANPWLWVISFRRVSR